MKKLTDYQGDEAIELWADILDPLTEILTDEKVRDAVQDGKSKMDIIKTILHLHKKEATKILLRIDPSPLDGLNIILRLKAIITDFSENDEIKSFFVSSGQEKTGSESSGLHMVSTEDAEN